MKKIMKAYWEYILAFMVPIGIVLIHCIASDTWLFGNGSILRGDAGAQYVYLFEELWNKVHSGDFSFYSWNALGGFDFYLNVLYYAISPATLVILLLPKVCLYDALQFFMVLKWAMMSVTAVYFFMHTRLNTIRENRKFVSLALGLCYAMSNYFVNTLQFFNWWDSFILFPVILLLVEKMVDNGKWKLYYLLLTLSMLCNFYISFPNCIFLLLWFILLTQVCGRNETGRWKVFVGSSVLSAVTAMAVILPSVMNVGARYMSDSPNNTGAYVRSLLLKPYEFVHKLFIFYPITQNTLPITSFYASIGLVMLCLLYVFIRLDKKSKYIKTGIILFLILSFFSGGLNYIWHGFAVPNGSSPRYAYLLTLMLLLVALDILANIGQIKLWHCVLALAVSVGAFAYTFFSVIEYEAYEVYVVTILLVVLHFILFVLLCRNSVKKSTFICVFLSVCLIEILANSFYQWQKYYSMAKASEDWYIEQACELAEQTEPEAGERCLIVDSGCNPGLRADVPCMTGFLSYSNGRMGRLVGKLCMHTYSEAGFLYNGSTPVLNLMFNIRYGIGANAAGMSDSEQIAEAEELSLYRTSRTAGLGYMADAAVSEWDTEEGSTFALQNAFIQKAAGDERSQVFKMVHPKDITCISSMDEKIEPQVLSEDILGETYKDAYLYNYVPVYTSDGVEIDFTVEENQNLYLAFSGNTSAYLQVFVNSEPVYKGVGISRQNIIHIGEVNQGDKVSVITYVDDLVNETIQAIVWLADFDEAAYQEAYEKISSDLYQIEEMSSDRISGSIEASDDGMMMTSIQAVEGFEVYVDEQQTEYQAVGGAWIGVPLEKGRHTVEFRYSTPYAKISWLISIAAFILYIGICIWDKKRRKQPEKDMKRIMDNQRRMDKLKKFIQQNWFYLVALILPCAIALIRSFVLDTWVTGNGNFATGDMQAQIIPICYELWDKVHSGDSFMYTWHIADGCDFHALSGYLFSPFTIIMLLFPRKCIPDFMQVTMIVKWSLAAFTMVYFFYHTKHNTLSCHKKAVSLFLGLAYALSNAVVSLILYVQFMDVLICFPLLLLLVEKLVDEKKWRMYYLLLTFCIVSNSYISFQICIFLVLWFFMQMNKETTEKWQKFCLFAGVSVLSAITTAAGLLTELLMAKTRFVSEVGSDGKLEYANEWLISAADFIKQLFIFEPIREANSRTPNIYLSVFIVLLVLLFPFIRLGRKRKAYILFIAVFLIASFFVGALSLVWHLFNVPNGLYHRFMYLFVFFMVFMVLCVLRQLEDIDWKPVTVAAVVMIAAYVYALVNVENSDSVAIYLATALLMAFYTLLMILYCRKSITYKNMLLVIAICGTLELTVNLAFSFRMYDAPLYFGENGFMDTACEMIEQADMEAGERIVTSNPTSNLGLMMAQNSDAGFMSSINTDNKTLHERLGMGSNSQVEFLSRGASPLVNLIFNTRYGLGESEMLFSDTELIDHDEFLQFYRMKRLAGLGYMVNSTIADWNDEDKNCFQFQNDFVNKAVGGEDVFLPVDTKDLGCHNLFGQAYEENEEYIEGGAYLYEIENQYGNEYDSLQLDFTAKEDMDLYMYFWTKDNYDVKIFIDGEVKHEDIRPFLHSTYHIGDVREGQSVVVCLVPAQNFDIGKQSSFMMIFGQFDEEAYAPSYEKLSKNVYDIEIEESDYIKGTIQTEEDGIMMTSIQAVDGFTVYVDGEETEYEVIGGAMIGVPLQAGGHTVEFRYRTPYLALGRGISGSAFAVFLLLCIYDSRKKKNKTIIPVEDAE